MANSSIITDNFVRNWGPYLSAKGGLRPDVSLAVGCGICGKTLVIGDEAQNPGPEHEACTILPCGHAVGYDCAKMWIESADNSASCPFCRLSLWHRACGHRFSPWIIGCKFLRDFVEVCGEGMPSVCWDCWVGCYEVSPGEACTPHAPPESLAEVLFEMNPFGDEDAESSRRRSTASPVSPFTSPVSSPSYLHDGRSRDSADVVLRGMVEKALSENQEAADLRDDEKERIILCITSRIMRSGTCGCEDCERLYWVFYSGSLGASRERAIADADRHSDGADTHSDSDDPFEDFSSEGPFSDASDGDFGTDSGIDVTDPDYHGVLHDEETW